MKIPKGFYKYIKDKRVTKERNGQEICLRVEPKEVGDILNEYFASVFTVEKDMEDKEHGEINSDILKNVHFREEEVLDILKRIKVDKSLGPDQVYPRALQEAKEVIAGPLAEIFVSSIVA
eukprot:g47652.t1